MEKQCECCARQIEQPLCSLCAHALGCCCCLWMLRWKRRRGILHRDAARNPMCACAPTRNATAHQMAGAVCQMAGAVCQMAGAVYQMAGVFDSLRGCVRPERTVLHWKQRGDGTEVRSARQGVESNTPRGVGFSLPSHVTVCSTLLSFFLVFGVVTGRGGGTMFTQSEGWFWLLQRWVTCRYRFGLQGVAEARWLQVGTGYIVRYRLSQLRWSLQGLYSSR